MTTPERNCFWKLEARRKTYHEGKSSQSAFLRIMIYIYQTIGNMMMVKHKQLLSEKKIFKYLDRQTQRFIRLSFCQSKEKLFLSSVNQNIYSIPLKVYDITLERRSEARTPSGNSIDFILKKNKNFILAFSCLEMSTTWRSHL